MNDSSSSLSKVDEDVTRLQTEQLDSVIVKEELFPGDISPCINNGDSISTRLQQEKVFAESIVAEELKAEETDCEESNNDCYNEERFGPIRLKEEFEIFEREEQETGDVSIPRDDLLMEKLFTKDDQHIMDNSNFEVFAESIVAEEVKAEDEDICCEESNTECYNENNEAITSSPEKGSQNTQMLKSERVSLEKDLQTHEHCRREEGISECSEDERRKRYLKVLDNVIGSQDSEASQIPMIHVKREEKILPNSVSMRSSENVDNNGYKCQPLLKDHNAVQEKKRSYVCDLCKKGFNRRGNLIRHLKIHTDRTVHECEVCKKYFPCHSELKRHQVIHSGNKPYACRYCERSFSCKSNLNRHLRVHTGIKTHKCQLCSIKFHTRFELNQHSDKFSSCKKMRGRFECKTCLKVFLYKSILSCHEMSHDTDGRFVCDYCLKVFSSKIIFERHILGHIEKRFEHKCKYCGKQFKRKDYLKYHESVHENERSHVCEFCKKGFCTRKLLNSHLLIHTGRKAHNCKICNKRFWHEFGLLRHLHIHETYTCDFCKKQFQIKSRLKTHILRHIGEKTHECQICRKKFLRNSDLTKHLQTHDKEGRFQCEFCDKKYRQKDGLRDHEKTHTNPMPFKCPFCTKCFSSRSSMNRHKKTSCRGEVNTIY